MKLIKKHNTVQLSSTRFISELLSHLKSLYIANNVNDLWPM